MLAQSLPFVGEMAGVVLGPRLNRLDRVRTAQAVILTTAAGVIFAVALSAWSSWERLATTNRMFRVRGCVGEPLFKAMHKTCGTDRPYTEPGLNGEQPLDREAEK